MPRFDLDQLRTLVTVAEAGSLSAAAPRLARSQSAVSEHIRKLEEVCGTTLLQRAKSGVSLTPAGDRLLDHARRLLALNDAAFQDMQGVSLAGDLHLAITDYFRPTALPGILRRLRDQYPQLHLHVSIRKSALIEEGAGGGDYDIGLSMRILERALPRQVDADGRIRLRREPLAWVAERAFAVPAGRVVPLVVMPETCSLQRFILKILKRSRTPYTIAHSASGIGGLQLALSAGLGVSCLNASATPPGLGAVARDIVLPALPEVEFSLQPPRPGERPVVADVRRMLAEQLQ
ncbi:MAG: LysR family transcriptional regulator [Xanthobacteraceae bacterium]|nr:LysR family transcriptional regulator [Xanthobacteraceae bacterium]